jgi:cephalosporin hydroxylase
MNNEAVVDIGRLEFFRHSDSFLTLAETATDRRFEMVYQKTYGFPGDYIDQHHQFYSRCPVWEGMLDIGIDGWLLPQDTLKLYELTYFCGGDVLELGTYRGLSTTVIALASAAAGKANVIVSVDLDMTATEAARKTLAGRPGAERVHLFTADAAHAVRVAADAKRQYDFVFVDHSHSYAHVYDVCRDLHRVLSVGAFCLLHDFNDPRNPDPKNAAYCVYQAAMDGLDPRRFEFWGIYGCCGLFRRHGPL